MKANLSPSPAHEFSKALAPLVSRAQTRPPLARQPRSLPRLDRGSDVATNAHRGRNALLRSHFLHRLPDMESLARAPLAEVLKLWSGLGYYSRARNLHRAAKEILLHHNGKFPGELDAALQLPGIGRYTAAAVLSIAFDVPLGVLDGNVARVLARLLAIRGDLRRAASLAPARRRPRKTWLACGSPGDWNQALMELGETICTPQNPRCEVCPISKWCRAYKLGLTDKIPFSSSEARPRAHKNSRRNSSRSARPHNSGERSRRTRPRALFPHVAISLPWKSRATRERSLKSIFAPLSASTASLLKSFPPRATASHFAISRCSLSSHASSGCRGCLALASSLSKICVTCPYPARPAKSPQQRPTFLLIK
jgi:adenine-specific DNA glycosylase